LREAAGVTQARLAQVLRTTTQTVKNWENGRSEPRPPRREAHLQLLEGWAAKHPAEPVTEAVPETFTGPAPAPMQPALADRPADDAAPGHGSSPRFHRSAASGPAGASRSASTSRRPASPKAAAPVADSRFPNGPLAGLDSDGTAYCLGGVLLDCPAATIPQLVKWVLKESGIRQPRLHRHGKDSDPLIVLTTSAVERFGLPARLEDRRGLRLAEDHPASRNSAEQSGS
jgi:hypothetical protein